MSDTTDLDPDELRRELDQIKGAMGLQERRPGWTRDALVFGVAVAFAGLVSQLIELRGMPEYFHSVTWFGTMGAAWILSYWVLAPETEPRADESAVPSTGFVYGALVATWLALQVLLGPAFGTPALPSSATVFGLTVILVGTAYLLIGQLLKAHYVRRRDRFAFYAGGAWMLPLGAAVTHVPLLQTYVYGVYGGCFLAYAVASYWVLTRT